MADNSVTPIASLWEHREAIGGGLIAVLTYLIDPPPRVVRIRRILFCLFRRAAPIPPPIAKEDPMSIFSSFESKLHAAVDAFAAHGSAEALKADLSAVYGLFRPILVIGAQALTPVIAKAAEDAIAAKIGGDIGATLGADAAKLITSEAAKI